MAAATVRAARESYIRWRLSHSSKQTIDGEQSALGHLEAWVGSERIVRDITPEMLERWWQSETMTRLADSTRQTRLSQVRAFLTYCRERGWLAGDPSSLLRAAVVRPNARLQYTATQLLELLEAAVTPRDRAVIAVGLNLALRGGEIARLRIKDVDLDAGTLHVQIDKTNEVDDMPITADLDLELRRWLTHYMELVPGIDRESYLFPAQHADNIRHRVTYKPAKKLAEPYLVVKRALEACGHPSDQEGVHTLRRSVAAIYFDFIEAEGSFDSALLATMTLLHHSRPETTLRYIGRDRQRQARDQLLRGKPFLTSLQAKPATPLRALPDIEETA